MADQQRTAIKLGGSLLHQQGWPSRLRKWLSQQPAGNYFFIVGGGLLIDALRDLDHQHPLSQVDIHWRCIRALDATYEIASELVPDFGRIGTNAELQSVLRADGQEKKQRTYWVRVGAFYSPEYDQPIPSELQLEQSWKTTSDSLALFLASIIGAERCVLLKACPVSHLHSVGQAIDEGIVDPECLRFRQVVPTIELIQI